jgi:transcriptional regulator with XRE-family HTH domain
MMPFAQPMTFGALIYELRVQRGWTQTQLARLAGITGNQVSNIEREVTLLPNVETVERLARAFGVRPEELDARLLADRVEQEAVSLVRRQAIVKMLNMSDRDVAAAFARLEEPPRAKRRRRRR